MIALPPDIALPVMGLFVLANMLTLGLFALNRAQSGDGEWRGAETRTLVLSFLGGFIGAKLGQVLFRQGPRAQGFGLMLNLSMIALPLVLAIPFLITNAPGWISQGVADYSAQYAKTEAEKAAEVSPLGLASGKAQPVVEEAVVVEDQAASAGAVEAAPVPEKVLPKRFGPGSDGKKKTAVGKTISVGN